MKSIKRVKTKDLSKVLTMTNTSDTNFISERGGKIYKTPFKGEATISKIDSEDLIMFQDTITDGEGTNKIVSITYGDMLLPITDPDNYPIHTETIKTDEDGYSIIPLERGSVDEVDGDLLEYDPRNPYIRSAVYIPIEMNTEYKFVCTTGEIYRLRILLCDKNKCILHDNWWNGISNYHNMVLSSAFINKQEEAKYMIFDIQGLGNPAITLKINTDIGIVSQHITINKLRFNDDYAVSVSETLENKCKQLTITHDNTNNNKISMFTIQAPTHRALDTRLRLLNAGLKTSQVIDLRSVRDDENPETQGRFEIGIRSFGASTPIPEFSVGFADTINGELIKRFIVDPDAMMVRLTKDGVQFRTSNMSNNKPGEKELYTINFKSLLDKLNKSYTSLLKHNLITEEVVPEGIETININSANVDYDHAKYTTVASALDWLFQNNKSVNLTNLEKEIDDLYTIISGIDNIVALLDLSVSSKIGDLSTTVNGYSSRIANAEAAATTAKSAADSLADFGPSLADTARNLTNLSTRVNTLSTNLNKKDEELAKAIQDSIDNYPIPPHQLVTNSNVDTIYIESNGGEIFSIGITTTDEDTGIAHMSMNLNRYNAVDGTDTLFRYRVSFDDTDIGGERQVTIDKTWSEINISLPITGITMGTHTLKIYCICDNGGVSIAPDKLNLICELFKSN